MQGNGNPKKWITIYSVQFKELIIYKGGEDAEKLDFCILLKRGI